jgi:hypothetical protein
MHRNVHIASGETYKIPPGVKLCIERIILAPTAPGTDMTLTISNNQLNHFFPSSKYEQPIQLDGPFMFRSETTSNVEITVADGAALLVTVDQITG